MWQIACMSWTISIPLAAVMLAVPAAAQVPTTPAEAADELLAADRAFSEASAGVSAVEGIAAMFARDIAMITPQGSFTRSRSEATAALRADPLNATARASWVPVRVGISADATQGFTMGVMTLRQNDGALRYAKYLAYWRKDPEGWRVVSYNRRAQEGAISQPALPPVLPERMVEPSDNARLIARNRASIDAAERRFSDEAQVIGLGPAFCKHGRKDATNLGGSKGGMLIGLDKICGTIGGPPPSPVTWAPDAVEVASSGDLGVTWGMIRRKGEVPAGQSATIPYTTVWVRSGPDGVWQYIAE
jgi:ketosteroid isomerase-like protein